MSPGLKLYHSGANKQQQVQFCPFTEDQKIRVTSNFLFSQSVIL